MNVGKQAIKDIERVDKHALKTTSLPKTRTLKKDAEIRRLIGDWPHLTVNEFVARGQTLIGSHYNGVEGIKSKISKIRTST